MAYTVRLNFSGLCFFDFQGGTLGDPDRARVLMVNATDKDLRYDKDVAKDDICVHRPRMVVSRKYLIGSAGMRTPSEIRPGPDGEDLAIYDLRGETLEIKTSKAQKDVTATRRPQHTTLPEKPGAAQVPWFDWTAPLKKLHPNVVGLHPDTASPGDRVTAILHLDDGKVETREVGKKYGKMLSFEFRRYDKTGSAVYGPHAIADRVQVKIGGLPDDREVQFVFANGEKATVSGGPGQTVEMSLTNLCGDREWKNVEWLTDFLWFYNLVAWKDRNAPPSAELIIPKVIPSGALTPSTGTCPPSTFG